MQRTLTRRLAMALLLYSLLSLTIAIWRYTHPQRTPLPVLTPETIERLGIDQSDHCLLKKDGALQWVPCPPSPECQPPHERP